MIDTVNIIGCALVFRGINRWKGWDGTDSDKKGAWRRRRGESS